MLDQIKVLIIATILIGCSDGKTEKQKLAGIEKDNTILALTCQGYDSYHTPLGDLRNNVWNAHSTKAYDWSQCIAMRTLDAHTQYGWYWQWPENGDKVYAQPQVTLGNSPWVSHDQAQDGFPIALSQLEKLDIDYSVEILTDGELNLASTLWLTRSKTIQTEIDRSTIAAEVMVWTYASDDFYAHPGGEEIAEITINGINWEVWWDKKWQDKSGLHDNSWVYLAFRSTQPLLQIHYDAAKMLRYAIDQKLIDPRLYIADIQLGTEIMRGTGQAWLNHYRVDVVPVKSTL